MTIKQHALRIHFSPLSRRATTTKVDPFGNRPPVMTKFGGLEGGQFEAFTSDHRNQSAPQFFVSEDKFNGAVRRWRPKQGTSFGWEMLHGEGELDYLEFLPGNRFQWTSNLKAGRTSARMFYKVRLAM